jgi:hypothetical protein
LPPQWFFSGPKQNGSHFGSKFGLTAWCSRSSHCSSWILSWVARAVWCLALSPLLPVDLNIFCKLHPKALTELHSSRTTRNLNFHRAYENGLTVLPENPTARLV